MPAPSTGTEPGRTAAVALVLVAAVLWGSTGTLQALLPEGRAPLAVGALRMALGAATLLALALCHGPSRRALARRPGRGVVLAGVAIGAYNLFFFRAVLDAGVGIGTAVTIGSAPLWTSAAERILWGRRQGALRLTGQAVSVAGVALLALADGAGPAPGRGLVLALAAGASYAAYSMLTARAGAGRPPLALAGTTFAVAALVTAPALALSPLGWLAAPGAWAPLLALGVGATGLAYLLYTAGLARLAPSTAVTLALAEPVTAWVLALVVVGERAGPAGAMGAVLVLAGLAIVTRAPAAR